MLEGVAVGLDVGGKKVGDTVGTWFDSKEGLSVAIAVRGEPDALGDGNSLRPNAGTTL